jgi:hypothetical protein
MGAIQIETKNQQIMSLLFVIPMSSLSAVFNDIGHTKKPALLLSIIYITFGYQVKDKGESLIS